MTSDDRSDIITELPSSVRRGVIYLVAAIVAAAIALLYFGRVYVIVNARGRIVPEGDVVLVQALERGVVSAVNAKAGDRLPAGAPILKIDLSGSGLSVAEMRQKQRGQTEQLAAVRATIDLAEQIVADPERALAGTRNRVVATVGKTAELVNDLENSLAKVEGAKAAAASSPSRRAGMSREVELTRENIRINETSRDTQARLLQSTEAALVQKQEQLDGYRRLAERRLLSTLELASEEERFRAAQASASDARRRFEQLDLDISNQRIKLAELEARVQSEPAAREAAFRQAQNAFRQTLALLRQEAENLRLQSRDLEAALATTQARLTLAENQVSLTLVTMPVAGIVAELKVTSAGELVTAGQLVATVVPEGVPLLVEAAVSNRDIGFVRSGIEGRVKVDAYPFQQFGTLPVRVRSVLPGLGRENNFTVRLELLRNTIGGVDGLPLFPGLAVEAELMTSRQRLIQLVLK